ncbi:hypothetical protein PF003_g2799 [Phytophthora fragariae]|nr:hypothetical protein PF003_g2799 [Phytophthora fragariae]
MVPRSLDCCSPHARAFSPEVCRAEQARDGSGVCVTWHGSAGARPPHGPTFSLSRCHARLAVRARPGKSVLPSGSRSAGAAPADWPRDAHFLSFSVGSSPRRATPHPPAYTRTKGSTTAPRRGAPITFRCGTTG